MKHSIPILCVFTLGLACPPPAAQPPLGPAQRLAGDTAIDLAGGEQSQPAIARGNGAWLVAWMDHRATFSSTLQAQGTWHVYAMRVDDQGQPIDPVPFPVTKQFGAKRLVRVAFNGTDWLVTWENETPTQFYKSAEVLATRVSTSGAVLDPTPISVYKYPFSSNAQYALGTDGSGFLVVTQGSSAGEDTPQAVPISATGQVGPAVPLPSGQGLELDYELAFAGGRYLLVWSQSNVGALLLDPMGQPQGGLFSISSPAGFPNVASNGTNFLITFHRPTTFPSLVAVSVTPAGVVGKQVQITQGSSTQPVFDSDVAWNGREWLVTWVEGLAGFSPTTMRAARLSREGTVLDPGGVPFGQPANPGRPVVSSSGSPGSSLVAWADRTTLPPHPGDVFATHLDSQLAAGPDQPLSVGQPRQGYSDLAAGGPGYIVVFTSERSGQLAIVAQRTDPLGRSVDANPIEVARGDRLQNPAVAWDGNEFLIVWQDPMATGNPLDDRVLGRRMAADGTFLDAAPLLVMDGHEPEVAAAGRRFLVAASRFSSTQIQNMFAARVDGSTGQVLDAGGFQIGSNYAHLADVGNMGSQWIVAWQRNFSHDNPRSVVLATVMNNDGTFTPSIVVAGSLTAGGGSDPAVAGTSGTALVATVGSDSGSSGVFGAMIGSNGQRLTPTFAIGTGPENQLDPVATWNGAEFAVAWTDYRSIQAFFDPRADIYAARVSIIGTLLDPTPIAVANEATFELQPSIAGQNGETLFGLSQLDPDPPIAALRITLVRQAEWQNLGFGLAGALGEPLLEARGAVAAGSTLQLLLSGGAAGSLGAHALGLARVDLPLLGGVLVPRPDVVLPFTTGAGGTATTTIPLAGGAPTGTAFYVQSWLADPTGPFGVTASNALQHVVR